MRPATISTATGDRAVRTDATGAVETGDSSAVFAIVAPPRHLTDGAALVTRGEGVGDGCTTCRLEAAR